MRESTGRTFQELHGQHQMPQIVPGNRNEEQPWDLMLRAPLFTLRVVPVCVLRYPSVYGGLNERKMRKERESTAKKEESYDHSFNRNNIK